MFLGKIKKSHEFSSVFKTGKYLKLPSMVVQYKTKPFKGTIYSSRYGLVVSKKVGNAVQRNFIKRRIRALLKNINFSFEKNSFDYVFVARKNLIKIKFSVLYIELCDALKKINQSVK